MSYTYKKFAAFIIMLCFAFSAIADEKVKEAAASMHKWISANGETVKAEFVKLQYNTVYLNTENGQVISIALQYLSKPDQELALKLGREATQSKLNALKSRQGAKQVKKNGLTEEQIKEFKTYYKDEDGETEYKFMSRFGYQSLTSRKRKKYAKSGEIPIRITASLYEIKDYRGKKKYKRLRGSANLCVLDSEGNTVIEQRESLSKLCPS